MRSREHRGTTRRQVAGATLVELAIAVPIFLMVVFAIAEMALMYQAKSVVDLAALAAARAGAVDHARRGATSKMQIAGATALAPLYMGGTASNGAVAQAALKAIAASPLALRIDVLNPTGRSFSDHGVVEAGQRQIPNDNLMYRSTRVAGGSGQNLQDANILKIRMTYCYAPQMPLHGEFLSTALNWINRARTPFCGAQGKIAIVSEAMVRMQSAAYQP